MKDATIKYIVTMFCMLATVITAMIMGYDGQIAFTAVILYAGGSKALPYIYGRLTSNGETQESQTTQKEEGKADLPEGT